MDDLARELGISKKTLYQHFPDKGDLVHATMAYQIARITEHGQDAFDNDNSPIEQFIQIGNTQCREMQHINPVLFYDLRKYYPKSMELFEDHKRKFIREKILENLRRGIQTGLYRDDIIPELIAEYYIHLITLITSGMNDYINSLDFSTVLKQLLLYNLNGITTQKGKLILQEKLENNEI